LTNHRGTPSLVGKGESFAAPSLFLRKKGCQLSGDRLHVIEGGGEGIGCPVRYAKKGRSRITDKGFANIRKSGRRNRDRLKEERSRYERGGFARRPGLPGELGTHSFQLFRGKKKMLREGQGGASGALRGASRHPSSISLKRKGKREDYVGRTFSVPPAAQRR